MNLSQRNKQHLFQTLQNCKQIPKDDRLVIRKFLLEGNQDIKNILTNKDMKRMQIKLRKFIQSFKDKKNGNQNYNQMLQPKWKNNFTKNNQQYKQKCPRIIDNYIDKTFGRINRNSSINKILNKSINKSNSINKNLRRKSIGNLSLQKSNSNNHIYQDNNKKQNRTITISNKQIKKQKIIQYQSQSYKCQDSNTVTPIGCLSRVNYNNNNNNYDGLFTNSQLMSQCRQFLNKAGLASRVNFNAQSLAASNIQVSPVAIQTLITQTNQPNIRSILLGINSEDLFDYIISNQVKENVRSPSSLFLDYHQFIYKLNSFLKRQKGQEIISDCNDDQSQLRNLLIIPPFQSEYQSVTLQKLIQFLNNYCFMKYNQIRTLYLQLDRNFIGSATIQQFNQNNQWRGQEIINLFRKLVNRWGKWGQQITYWQMYWAKDSQQMKQFIQGYKN